MYGTQGSIHIEKEEKKSWLLTKRRNGVIKESDLGDRYIEEGGRGVG